MIAEKERQARCEVFYYYFGCAYFWDIVFYSLFIFLVVL